MIQSNDAQTQLPESPLGFQQSTVLAASCTSQNPFLTPAGKPFLWSHARSIRELAPVWAVFGSEWL